jgi:hypothetical protein
MARASLPQILAVLLEAESDLRDSPLPEMAQWRAMFIAQIVEAARRDPTGAETHLPALRQALNSEMTLGAFPVALPAIQWAAPLIGAATLRGIAFLGVLTISGMHAAMTQEDAPATTWAQQDAELGELVDRAKQRLDKLERKERLAKYPIKTLIGLTGLTSAWLLLDDYGKRLIECADAGIAYFLVGGLTGYLVSK